jgi:hypothetical protein
MPEIVETCLERIAMNTKFFSSALIAAATFAAAPSFAADNISGEVGYVPAAPVASTSNVSRAQVQGEYLQALRNDALPQTGEAADLGAVADSTSNVSRAAVRAEAAYAVRQGQTVGGEV